KCYYPAAFTAALLRAQPMGFYSPASLVSDARRHGVEVRSVDVNASAALAALENPTVAGQPAIRLGLSDVRNLGADAAAAIVAGQPYRDLEDFARRTRLPAPALEARAAAGAAGAGGRVGLLRDREGRGAVGGGDGGHHRRGAAARAHPGPGRAAAAADDGGRGDLRRPVGDRNLRHPPDRAHPSRPGRA